MRLARCAGAYPATSICSVQSTVCSGATEWKPMRSGNTGSGPKPAFHLVAGTDLGVAVAIRGVCELERDVGIAVHPVQLRTPSNQLGGELLADEGRQELAHDHVLVVPGGGATRLLEEFVLSGPSARRRSTRRLCSLKKATAIWLVNRWTSFRGSPISAIPSRLRGTSMPSADSSSLAGS